eukprot:2718299-Pyramimonas_sp.AAC.1
MPRLLRFATLSWTDAALTDHPSEHPVGRRESAAPAELCDSVVDGHRAQGPPIAQPPMVSRKHHAFCAWAHTSWVCDAVKTRRALA